MVCLSKVNCINHYLHQPQYDFLVGWGQWPNSSPYTDDKEDIIVFIIIDSKHSLDQFSKDTAQHTKMPATRLRSAIAKGQNCADIAILTNQLTPAPVIAPS